MIKKVLLFLFLFGLFSIETQSQISALTHSERANNWADSVYQSLTDAERIAQLIFIRANYSGQEYLKEVPELIEKYNLGGVTFFAKNPIEQAKKTNEWNKLAKTPLFFSIDAEWGLGMRLKNTLKYPLQMTLGAVSNDSLLYQMGLQIGEQCQRMGIQINFAPVVDVNNNPLNPVIGMRSFGEIPTEVGEKGFFYMKGLQDKNVIASAKHFPGHGDTEIDSHLDLPVLKKSKKELKATELIPFQSLINNGVASVMVAHLSVPAFDKRKKRPATLSSKIIEKQLKQKMGFTGLVISDGLDMKGITKYYKEGEIALEAFLAGNDILLIPDNIPLSIKKMLTALENGKIKRERLQESCKKALRYKYLTGASRKSVVEIANLEADLNKPQYLKLQQQLFEKAITIVKNDKSLIPVSFLDTIKPALIILGEEKEIPFEKPFHQFIKLKTVRLRHDATVSERQNALLEIEDANMVIVAVVNTNILASKVFGISQGDFQFIEHIARKKVVVLDMFASPYSLDQFSNTHIFNTIIVSYQDKPYVQEKSAEIILGMFGASGHLPVGAGRFLPGTSIITSKTRLSYASPSDLDIDEAVLQKVDSIAQHGVNIKAFPGCQIVVAKDGYIFYDKAFGHHTYDEQLPVNKNDVYDLASLTKILAATPAIMQMVDLGKVNIDGRLSDYLQYLKGTNKEDLLLKDILTHQAGLKPWIPYFQNTLFENNWDTSVYRSIISEEFPVRVAQNMYIREDYKYEVIDQIILSEIGEKEYAYSDLGFYFFKEMIEQLTNRPFEKYLNLSLYEPLGLNHLRFRPRKYFPLKTIIPTENDKVFRHQQLVGDVHDQGAAMLGGVSGHAGLFGNAYDVTVIMQMFLNGGKYGGRTFFSKEIVDEFTSCQFPDLDNRRGLGFDKPMLEYEDHRSNCKSASPSSFGHSGFTGTYAWADPETGLVYVFLTNRIYPRMDNSLILELDVRTNIHQLFYDSIEGK